ncbi:YceI family protein [Streptomyces himalayensis]|uniref:YceI family protein n=1 Tax=Streptomyces himalayensis subsp. himalayensis TaxID=2756131 RepID=A0A7W0DN52_9ACTN|nr:YceI family protein [Streptomyces himalayensis]MBA2947790.1 YceI family protein [Streptomyces himalayensis subsp. himalayensis]
MSVAVETGIWQLDPARSTVGIRHKTMWGMVTVKGTFTGLTGGGEVGPDGSASGSITLNAASLDTKNAKRDTHLRSADFFDADRHPEITFAVRSATPGDDKTVQVAGQLTVRGISRPQSFTAHLSEASVGAVTLTVESAVDREQFGMGWNQMGMMRGHTTVTASLRFVRATS